MKLIKRFLAWYEYRYLMKTLEKMKQDLRKQIIP